MIKPDSERIKKIVQLWNSLKKQMADHNITKDLLLNDEFSQWAVQLLYITSVNRLIKSVRKQRINTLISPGRLFPDYGTD